MKQSLQNWEERNRSSNYWLAIWFGAGLLRPAPGTWGSLAAVFLAFLGYRFGLDLSWAVFAVLAVTVVGTVSIERIQRQSGVHDAPEIVVDEVAGQWIAVLPVFLSPVPENLVNWVWLVAFILFRLLDIWKPWPIRWVDRTVHGGFGVMLDDLIAGLLTFAGIEIFLIIFS